MATIKGIFVRNTKEAKYADLLADLEKPLETRSRNTLGRLAWEDVAIIRTGNGRPTIIGYINFGTGTKLNYEEFRKAERYHLVPKGSDYDCKPGSFKWVYPVNTAHRCAPHPLPDNAIRHGRVWCEFEDDTLEQWHI